MTHRAEGQASGAVEVVYLMEPIEDAARPLVYLAGPVPRDPGAGSWHAQAISTLAARDFSGSAIVPRPRQGGWPEDRQAHMEWEEGAQKEADAILFWVPRRLPELPGLTTNLEWGIWHDSGKAVLGAPPEADKMRYLRYWAGRAGAPQAETLTETIELVLDLLDRPEYG